MTILYGSYSHNPLSIFMILSSIAAFFGIFWLFSFLGVSTLDNLFNEISVYPIYLYMLVFIFLVTFPIDSFLNFLQNREKEKQYYEEKRIKNEEKEKLV